MATEHKLKCFAELSNESRSMSVYDTGCYICKVSLCHLFEFVQLLCYETHHMNKMNCFRDDFTS